MFECMAVDGLWNVSTMSTMTLTKVEKTSLIIHDTHNHAHCRALHLASGIHTQAFCPVPTVTFLLQINSSTTGYRKSHTHIVSTGDMCKPMLFDLCALGYFSLDLIHASRLRKCAQIA